MNEKIDQTLDEKLAQEFDELIKDHPLNVHMLSIKPPVMLETKIENGLNISFEDLTLFADSKTEDELITSTAKVYLKLTDKKKIDNLPMLKFLRLMEYAKDITIYANKLFSTMKREYTKEEKEAGIENIKSDDFDLIDAFCKRNGIQNRDDGYKEHWIVIYRCLKRDFDMAEFNRRYAEVIEGKYKKK